MAEISLRRFAADDFPRWAELRQALWPHHSLAELEGELPALMAAGRIGFGAFDGSRLVGFAEAGERPQGDGCDTAPVGWLEGIYVVPTYRRHGVARQLVTAVEAWARQRAYAELGSDAELANLLSRLAHARWGFEETERVVMLRKVLE